MDITVIGTGNMARGIATRLLAGGHGVTLLGTTQDKAQALAGELPGEARTGTVGDPLAGDVIVLAVWYPVVADVLGRYGSQLDGKIVVDITNPLDVDAFEPITIEGGPGSARDGGDRARRPRREGLQHHLRRHAPGGPGLRPPPRRVHRLRRR